LLADTTTREITLEVLFIRSDSPYKTVDDLRKIPEPAHCGATGIGFVDHYFPKLLEEILCVKFNIMTGYPGAAEKILIDELRASLKRF
jgi:hypothetical protein